MITSGDGEETTRHKREMIFNACHKSDVGEAAKSLCKKRFIGLYIEIAKIITIEGSAPNRRCMKRFRFTI